MEENNAKKCPHELDSEPSKHDLKVRNCAIGKSNIYPVLTSSSVVFILLLEHVRSLIDPSDLLIKLTKCCSLVMYLP